MSGLISKPRTQFGFFFLRKLVNLRSDQQDIAARGKFTADKILLFSILLSFIAIMICVFLVIVFYQKLPPVLPLFNQLSWGEARLGTKIQLGIPVSIAAIVLLINPFLSLLFYKELPLVSRIISITTLTVAVLSLIFIIRTIRIVV
ncbi:MAG: hypothetical protein HY429_03860 [Candidatus Levybacteria bacterium]|nr:hypothetical protein [Candidatus Levybacteria bacterium]